MRLDALEHVDLHCAACRTFAGETASQKLRLVPGETEGSYVITGYLECPGCGQTYPVDEGVPCLIGRHPGDAGLTPQYLDAHYGHLNDAYWRRMNGAAGGGLCLDVGCATGRYTFELGRRGFAVGMDVNFEQLRLAASFQRAGRIGYTRRTRALAGEEVASGFAPSENVLFLLADIHNPPFAVDTFDFIAALNLVDSVRRPLTALGQMDAMLKTGGQLFLSAPYVWDGNISEEFLETEETAPHDFVRQLLTGQRMPECGFNYRLAGEAADIPWLVRKQDTSRFEYLVDALELEKLPGAEG